MRAIFHSLSGVVIAGAAVVLCSAGGGAEAEETGAVEAEPETEEAGMAVL